MPKGARKKAAGAATHKPAAKEEKKEELVAAAANAGVGGEEIPAPEDEKPGFGYSDRPPKRAAAKKAAEAAAAASEQQQHKHKSTSTKKKSKAQHDESEYVEVEAEVAPEEKTPPAKRAKKSSSTSTGSQHQTKSAATSEHALVEAGDIYFFYRPKIDKTHCATIQDVQRLYMLMVPTEQPEEKNKSPSRMIVIPKKHLPAIATHEKLWGLVYKVSHNINEMRDDLLSKTYQTKTRGERHAQPARPAGFGVYRIIRDHKHTTHLCYVLSVPDHLGGPQKALGLKHEGSFVLNIKSPAHEPAPNAPKSLHRPEYPPSLVAAFEHYKWVGANPPKLLDYPGAEILLIGAHDTVSDEAGKDLVTLGITLGKHMDATSVLQDLHATAKQLPPKPLEGKWD